MEKQVGHYRIVRELGRGAMGVVYLAHEESLNREVALKVLTPSLAGSEEDFQRFRLEAQSLAKLNHRNIVQIYFVGEDADRHFFAMEYVPSSLHHMLRDQGSLESSRAAQLVLNAASGLAAAHEHGIVHRDVKPANLLVAEDGTLKVADFGIARMAAAATRLTAADAILGTPRYLSPEQCEGVDGDARSDIYSLGVTYYEMLSGQAPFRSTSALALVREILHDTPPPIEEIMPEIDHRTRTIVGKMMAKSADDRYQSARELAADLQAHLLSRVMPDWDGRGSFKAPAGATAPLATSPAVAPPAAAPPAVAPPALEAVADSDTWPASDAEPALVAEAAASRRRSAWPLLAAVLALLMVGGAAAATLLQGDAVRQALASATGAMKDLLSGESDESDESDKSEPAQLVGGPETEEWSPLTAEVTTASPAVEPAGRPRTDSGRSGERATAALPRAQPSTSSEPVAREPAHLYRAAELRGVALAVWGDDPLIAGALDDYLRRRLGSEVELVAGPTLAEATVEGGPPPGVFLRTARDQGARHAVMVTSTFLREVPLEYYGHRDVVYQSRVTVEGLDTASQELVTQWKGTVQYNAIRPEQALAETLEGPLGELIEALR